VSGEVWGACVVAFVLAMILTPAVKQFCQHFQLLVLPGPLKIHTRPVPGLGGVAIAIAICGGMSFAGRDVNISAWLFFAALGLIWMVGLTDDIYGLHVAVRLAAQISAAFLLWFGGWRISLLGSETLSLVGTCIFVVACVNAFNFLDGADGLAAGTALVVALGYAALPGAAHGPLSSAVAWSLLGACAGFLVFNFPPAKIFMGDSGSTVLGFGIAFLGLDYYRAHSGGGSSLFFPILAAGLPLLDCTLAVFRRLRSRISPSCGDRRHFYDLLLARGWSPRSVALTCYILTAALVTIGWLGTQGSRLNAFLSCTFTLGALLSAGLWLGSLEPERPNPQAQRAQSGGL
jgi:UDP-GlcNAc:undecaprenyl-phosphate/decaprenyl-phosphate GlcNAc-1-phosphate transferase